ncbi:DNA adenine methylase [Tenacibaculum maritimum]|uniref:DNA adenine methylase n=1 Tax=Tenacibaculum maritimum TaxID=107401 RepID=UPI0012E5BDF8|nr:DNA adenine methylase [Tenacibaculum maritimum]CAA0221941.1 DNA methyltransferase [Tenacibaculum maritimum]
MSKKFKASPLPFQGQKRKFLKKFKSKLREFPSENIVYVDLFGGSGILSNTIKDEKPKATVIYNDYDNFKKRLKNIPKTNEILEKLRLIVKDTPSKSKIEGNLREAVIKLIEDYAATGYVDYISISSNLLFSMGYAFNLESLKKQTFYNKVRKHNYNAENYLKGVEIVSLDYKLLFNKYKRYENVVFIVDPPYLSTNSKTYKNYWKLTDYLNVLKVLKSNNYFYFTSSKSNVIELCEWISNNTGGVNPFEKSKVIYQYATSTHNSSYTDIMLYKKHP